MTGIIDPPREEAKHSVNQCKIAGIRTIMITGDHQQTALAIAKELGIAANIKEKMTGQQLNDMTDLELQLF